jgi:hypothetical protein
MTSKRFIVSAPGGKIQGRTKSVYLDEAPPADAGLDQGLGDPSGGVGGRPVDLGVVLAGECAATVSAPAAVGVDDDLAAGQAGIALLRKKKTISCAFLHDQFHGPMRAQMIVHNDHKNRTLKLRIIAMDCR